ncbi:hypothetical protein [Arthrobacter sp. CAN_C5]|uniref:hypothetical protein n=1 Tax=Arthrobacter sp. CAN_C5 TaxID=2760706 RepID=UPI001AE6C281|nr:hypothetical protein [Arthrobacter sp. CAN_C5]MBP2216706.1 DNA-directed RNA polymerase sigma subunit (sigma70/sigma32) [Arthrobacter sp. CAN_C5]
MELESIARRDRKRGIDVLNHIQEGNTGLWRADKTRTIRIPVYFVDQITKVMSISAQLGRTLDRVPEIAEIAAATKLTAAKQ